MSCHRRVLTNSLAAILLSVTLSAARAQTYKAIGEYKLSGSSAKGIAVDSESRRIFVAGDDGILVLDADTGASAGAVGGLKNVQDVLLIPATNGENTAPSTKGFASDAAGNIIAFSLADLKPLGAIRTDAAGPTSLCYDSDTKTVEAVGAAGSLTTIDSESDKEISSARMATGSGQIVCGNMGHVYVADPDANVVHVLNHQTLKNDGDYPMKSGMKPTGLALDTKGRRLFVTCVDGTVEIIDTDAGFTFIELKGGTGVAHETFAWLPQGKGQWKAAAFVAQTDGTLSGIRMNAYINYTMGGQYKLAPGLGAVAYDDKTHHLFLTSIDAGSPVVVVAGY
jgi:DNA-binding beta-propeller fold protein YncE